MALAITPPGEFGDLPNCGKASNRGSRPHSGSDRSAEQVDILIHGDGKESKEVINLRLKTK